MLKKSFDVSNRYEDVKTAVFGTQEYAFQSNVDEEDIRIVNPNDGKIMGRPTEDIEYGLLVVIIAGHRSYYSNAMVTRDYETRRDSYDVSLFARCMNAEIHEADIFRRNRERKPEKHAPKSGGAQIFTFPSPR
jgi:hypothetical protein